MLYLFKFKSIHFGEKKSKWYMALYIICHNSQRLPFSPVKRALFFDNHLWEDPDIQLYNLARGILKWENYKKKQLACSPLLLFSFVS